MHTKQGPALSGSCAHAAQPVLSLPSSRHACMHACIFTGRPGSAVEPGGRAGCLGDAAQSASPAARSGPEPETGPPAGPTGKGSHPSQFPSQALLCTMQDPCTIRSSTWCARCMGLSASTYACARMPRRVWCHPDRPSSPCVRHQQRHLCISRKEAAACSCQRSIRESEMGCSQAGIRLNNCTHQRKADELGQALCDLTRPLF